MIAVHGTRSGTEMVRGLLNALLTRGSGTQ